MEKENDEGHSKTPRWALTLTEWPPRSSGKSSQYSAHPGRFRWRAFLLGAERSKLHKFGRRRWKRKGGNTDDSSCERLLRRVGFCCLGGRKKLVFNLGSDCDASCGSIALRLLDWSNEKNARTIAVESIAVYAFRGHPNSPLTSPDDRTLSHVLTARAEFIQHVLTRTVVEDDVSVLRQHCYGFENIGQSGSYTSVVEFG
jgi:hypothetical protein